MSRKYYAHFVTDTRQLATDAEEYRGVVELRSPLRPTREAADLRVMLARNFDLQTEDIRILNWATLH